MPVTPEEIQSCFEHYWGRKAPEGHAEEISSGLPKYTFEQFNSALSELKREEDSPRIPTFKQLAVKLLEFRPIKEEPTESSSDRKYTWKEFVEKVGSGRIPTSDMDASGRALFEQLAAKGVDPVSALSDPWGDGDWEEGGER
tara:strand:- start:2406 stop:2831 length:426 start_codon:yes stop_codon:yes gene_type:complete